MDIIELGREKIKPVYDWRDANNPCPNCTINKKDHWDIIHYKCELNHKNSCKILIDFQNELTNKNNGRNERSHAFKRYRST